MPRLPCDHIPNEQQGLRWESPPFNDYIHEQTRLRASVDDVWVPEALTHSPATSVYAYGAWPLVYGTMAQEMVVGATGEGHRDSRQRG